MQTDINARNEAGTLLCICGKPGVMFVCADSVMKDGKQYGIFRGLCSDECYAIWKQIKGEYVPIRQTVNYEQPTLFG